MTTFLEALTATYFDKADVYRLVDTEDAHGITKQTQTKVLSAISCGLSQSTRQNTNQTEVNRAIHTYTLFTLPSYNIKTGDEIRVTTEMGQAFTLKAHKPFIYASHQEIPCELDEKA